jgi:hypothetical protein
VNEIMKRIYQELLLVLGDCSKQKPLHIIRLNELLNEYVGTPKPVESVKPKKHLESDI